MPDLDLDPGSYTERKPKGWRWRLPWGHPEDSKLPLVGCALALGGLIYVFTHRAQLSVEMVFAGAAITAAVAGVLFAVAFRDTY